MRYNELNENDFLQDKDEIIKWMRESFTFFKPTKLTIEPDGLIYDGNLSLSLSGNINEIKIQFKEVTGYFEIDDTKITSLVGCPQTVGGYFSCFKSKITSLKFCPQSIGTEFYCGNTKITDPKEYRFALYSEIGGKLQSRNAEIDEIINTYRGSGNRKYWPEAINLLSKIEL